MKIQYSELKTRLGSVIVFAHQGAVCALGFAGQRRFLLRSLRRRFGTFQLEPVRDAGEAARALRAYFAGKLDAIANVPLDLAGTEFQRRVWQALRRIPAGETVTYAALARGVGRPRAVRAVASANANNPACLLVPCHRVIGTDGALRGYAGGLYRKRQLLEHEGALTPA
ncbi:MAG: methylated-DNA--[protein]-cysteine S-methyltransferase [Candidatus Eiseniibacteriota bacterium]